MDMHIDKAWENDEFARIDFLAAFFPDFGRNFSNPAVLDADIHGFI
jgi:hypothetical protein